MRWREARWTALIGRVTGQNDFKEQRLRAWRMWIHRSLDKSGDAERLNVIKLMVWENLSNE